MNVRRTAALTVVNAVLAAGLVACGGQSEPDGQQASEPEPSASPSPSPTRSPPDQLAAFCEGLAPLADDYRPGGLVLSLSEGGYDEADQEAINDHLLDAYDLADRNRSHQDPEVAELAGGYVDDIAELEDSDGSVPTREAMTAAGIFVLGTGAVCVDAGHLDPIE